VRKTIAEHVSKLSSHELPWEHVVLCSGAGSGLNLLLKTLLDPGDEVIVLSPYFLEYVFYVENYGGVLVEVPTDADFLPDVDVLASALTARTKAIIVNSPNNPTGVVYPRERLAALGDVLGRAERELGREIYMIYDEPYRHLVYDADVEVPWAYDFHPNSLVVTSYSKDLGLAGERIGYVAVGPACVPSQKIIGGMIFSLRALGFVNAPALMQHVVAEVQDARVDLTLYRRNRDLLVAALREMGYVMPDPAGAFYLFPASPLPDEIEFAARLREERILVVPGRGFGTMGHFRISYSVETEVCERALPGFERALRG
jgi:aspartate aminotransferase